MNFDVLFPDEREKGETRLKQCQLVMLRMLKIFNFLCDKHNVQYFLSAGTLLGVIRHKGFIPWDDDLDIGMTRANYEKFVEFVVPELPNDIFFQTPETDPYFPSCYKVEAKLRDKYSTYMIKERPDAPKWQNGLMLDILIYDRAFLPHNGFIYAVNRFMMVLYSGMKPKNQGNKKRARFLKAIAKWSPFPLVYSNSFIRKKNMIRQFGPNYFTESEIKEVEIGSFEGIAVLIPKGWHTYLQRKYGDYMQPPPEKKQKNHHGPGLPDPFTASRHAEVLQWKDRKPASLQN